MSAICVLTPLVVSSWPVVASAITGAGISMGFSARGSQLHEYPEKTSDSVEMEIANSDVVADEFKTGQRVTLVKDDITIEFGVDERGRCRACVTGNNRSKAELRKIGNEVAGRVVQQFAYHKTCFRA